jgi:hypothetical protein
MTKQTAVEWLVKELNLEGYDYTVEQAKEMEKKQIMDAFENGENKSAELYYNENYGGNQSL